MRREPIPYPYYLPKLLAAMTDLDDRALRLECAAQLAALALYAVGWEAVGGGAITEQFADEELARKAQGYLTAACAGEWSLFEGPVFTVRDRQGRSVAVKENQRQLPCGCRVLRPGRKREELVPICAEGRRLEAEMVAIFRNSDPDKRERWRVAQEAFCAHFV